MPDERPPRQPFRERHQDRHAPRPGGPPGARPGFPQRPPGAGPRPPFPPRPAPDTVTVKLRDGDREVEVSGSLAACRAILDELPGLWGRVRPQAASATAQPSIALPPPPPAVATPAGAAEPARPERAPRTERRHASNGAATSLDEQVVSILRAARRPVGIAEIRAQLGEEVSGQAVRRILERTQGVANVGGRPAAYRLR